MVKFYIIPLLMLGAIVCCMGQTFQYSRGWTNGKRNPAHFRDEIVAFPELNEYQDNEKRLEKCLVQLQRFIHNPLLLRNPFGNANNRYPGHHQSNEIIEDLSSVEHNDFTKNQPTLLSA